MCWRGHDPLQQYKSSSGGMHCKVCHRRRMRMYRRGNNSIKMPRFRLNKELLKKKVVVYIAADLADIPRDTMYDYSSRGASAHYANAVAIANAVRIPFEKLWSRVQ